MVRTMSRQTIIAARVEPELHEAFSLACQLRGTNASAALRSFMRDYIARASAPENGNGHAPGMENVAAAGSTITPSRGGRSDGQG